MSPGKPDALSRDCRMAEVDEPYIAVLQGIINGEMVAHGEPKVISASTFIEEAKVEAFKNE
jgi:hypothetical protein